MKNLTTLFRYNFARKIANKNIPTTTTEPASPQDLEEIEKQFIPIKQKITQRQVKMREKVAEELSFVGEDPTPNKLVNRPSKGAVWGLGGQLVMASKKVELEGLKDDPDEIMQFLELHQVKNIYLHDWSLFGEEKSQNRKRYAFLGSCFSARHCWRTAIQLKNAFNRNSINVYKGRDNKYDPITALMAGKRDEEWNLVQYKDFQIHLMTEQQREAIDLEWKWNNETPEETIDKWVQINNNRKKRKNQFEDFS